MWRRRRSRLLLPRLPVSCRSTHVLHLHFLAHCLSLFPSVLFLDLLEVYRLLSNHLTRIIFMKHIWFKDYLIECYSIVLCQRARRHRFRCVRVTLIELHCVYLRRHIYGERNWGIFEKKYPHIFILSKFWPPFQNPPNKFFCYLLEKG